MVAHPDWAGLGLLLAQGLAVAWLGCVCLTWRLLARPPRRTAAFAIARGLPSDPGELAPAPAHWGQWTVRWRGVDIPVWELPGARPQRPTVVLTHGWGDSRVTMLGRADALRQSFARVVLWDLPGHGEAPGSCALGLREAGALGALLDRLDGPAVLYGFSLGAGLSIRAAAERPESAGGGGARVTGVIAEAPYALPGTPARAVARMRGLDVPGCVWAALLLAGLARGAGPRWLRAGGGFDRRAWAAQLRSRRVPLLVLHGSQDAVCPIDDGRAIAGAGGGQLRQLAGCSHLTMWRTPGARDEAAAAVEAMAAAVASA
ncbi:MAG: hypothetical protein C0475_05105 [Planctomyces sp.]|nr:hypothetical protein [Planctomyces sp.]MBA4039482.1 hypothetical protein [Planctomyces sp.]